MTAIKETTAAEIKATAAHYNRLARAMAGDVSRLTPEMIGEEAMELGALLLAVMDRLNEKTGLCGHIVLSLVQEHLWAHACDWSKATFDLVDGADLRAVHRHDEDARRRRKGNSAYAEQVQTELVRRKAA